MKFSRLILIAMLLTMSCSSAFAEEQKKSQLPAKIKDVDRPRDMNMFDVEPTVIDEFQYTHSIFFLEEVLEEVLASKC